MWRSGRGVKGAAHGCYITTGGGLHTEWAHFHFLGGGLGGWGKVWDTSPGKCLVNKDIAPLTEPSYDCLSSSTLPAEHGPHCLPYCNTNSHTLFPISVPVGLKDEGTLNGLSRDKPFSRNSTEGKR